MYLAMYDEWSFIESHHPTHPQQLQGRSPCHSCGRTAQQVRSVERDLGCGSVISEWHAVTRQVPRHVGSTTEDIRNNNGRQMRRKSPEIRRCPPHFSWPRGCPEGKRLDGTGRNHIASVDASPPSSPHRLRLQWLVTPLSTGRHPWSYGPGDTVTCKPPLHATHSFVDGASSLVRSVKSEPGRILVSAQWAVGTVCVLGGLSPACQLRRRREAGSGMRFSVRGRGSNTVPCP